ncbi:MAG: TolC family protein [Bacteroidia bacterium]
MKGTYVVFALACSWAQERVDFSLKDCISYALKNQPTLQNAYLDYQIAKATVGQVRSIGLPQINGTLSLRKLIEIPTALLPGEIVGAPRGTFIPVRFGVPYNLDVGAQASQLLFDGTYFVGLQAAKVVKDITYKSYQRSRTETIASVKKAYYNVLIFQQRIQNLRASLQQLSDNLQQLQKLYQAGVAEKVDVQRLEVAYANLETEYQKALQSLGLAYTALKFQMGMPLETPLRLTDTLQESFLSTIAADTGATFDIQRRWEYQTLLSLRKANELDIRRYRVSYLPTLVGVAAITAQAQRKEFDFFDTKKRWFPIVSVGVQIQVPIFDGLNRYYQIRKATLELQKTRNNLMQFTQAAQLEVQSAKINLSNALRTLEIQKRNKELAQEVLSTLRLKYQEGTAPNIELLQAQTAYDAAEASYSGALLEAYAAYVDLQKALGTLEENPENL